MARGAEPELERALLSSVAAGPGSAVRMLVASTSDPAYAVAVRVARALSLGAASLDARVVVTGARGPNRKAEQLARALAAEPVRTAHVVVADSDVELTGGVLEDLLEPLALGDAAATWAPPIEVTPRTPADRASQAVLDASLHAFALLSALDAAGLVGKLFAIRREALDRIGGFATATLTGRLGEDMGGRAGPTKPCGW